MFLACKRGHAIAKGLIKLVLRVDLDFGVCCHSLYSGRHVRSRCSDRTHGTHGLCCNTPLPWCQGSPPPCLWFAARLEWVSECAFQFLCHPAGYCNTARLQCGIMQAGEVDCVALYASSTHATPMIHKASCHTASVCHT